MRPLYYSLRLNRMTIDLRILGLQGAPEGSITVVHRDFNMDQGTVCPTSCND